LGGLERKLKEIQRRQKPVKKRKPTENQYTKINLGIPLLKR